LSRSMGLCAILWIHSTVQAGGEEPNLENLGILLAYWRLPRKMNMEKT